MRKVMQASIVFLALSAATFSVYGQGGGGSPGGITLRPGGSHPDDSDKQEKANPNERPVTGVVTDADGKPVAGAVVELKNTETQQVQSVTTRDKGAYRFSGLKKDVDYQVKAIFKNQASPPHTLSALDPRTQPVVNLQIK